MLGINLFFPSPRRKANSLVVNRVRKFFILILRTLNLESDEEPPIDEVSCKIKPGGDGLGLGTPMLKLALDQNVMFSRTGMNCVPISPLGSPIYNGYSGYNHLETVARCCGYPQSRRVGL